ncbi:NADH-quinone oxidoreductase subunit G [Candidatus Entotheonella serta]|nr:NADH-quinone oxidoreductase subunit G [Candidatus Entotheonella serta]
MPKKLTIDGKKITARDEATIIQAAYEAGITIPHYCYHPKLSIAGNCRMCLVELEGRPKLEISCNTPVGDDMVVFTNSDRVVEGRRGVLEFLLINHPLDCPICDQAGECGLQDYYMQYGLNKSRFQEEKVHKNKVVDFGPDIVFDGERCILCTRCVRYTQEITQTNELGIFNRGDTVEISTFPGKQLDNPYAGNVVDVCPVGALTSKDFRFKMRVWFLKEAKSICPGCSRGCNINVHYNQDRVYRLKPRQNDDVNELWLCDAGRYGYKSINDQRVPHPMVRQGDALAQTDLQTALSQASHALEQHAGDGVGIIAAPQGTNEDLYLLSKLANRVSTTAQVLLYLGEPGDEDDFLIRADKNPNAQGAEALGFPAPASTDATAALAQAIEQGSIKVLYAIDTDLEAAFGADVVERLAAKLDCLIVQTSNERPGWQFAHVVLPSAVYAERDGTFTNFEGRVQRLNPAFAPRGEALPAWQLYQRLSQALGHADDYASAEAILAELATTIPAFSGMSYAKVGDLGQMLSSM